MCIMIVTMATAAPGSYEVWDDQPAPNRGPDPDSSDIPHYKGYPFDDDWEKRSFPLGNGYMGINMFGRTDVERIQVTEKTFYNKGMYNSGGLTNFIELYLEFGHPEPKNYRRALNLNEAVAYVEYGQDGTGYKREYFVSYPDQVSVVHLTADRGGQIDLTIRPEIPYMSSVNPDDAKTGTIVAEDDTITLAGTVRFRNLNYEAQVRVLQKGGSRVAENKDNTGTIRIEDADEVTILFAAGTNYHLRPDVFMKPNEQKLDADEFPHDEVSSRIQVAGDKGYEQLKAAHLQDYQHLFDRVHVSVSSPRTEIPTRELVRRYKEGNGDPYLEEMMFHYGRYLLLASSREKTLPSGLQGGWTQYERTPWTGTYWHNINVQMNYWGAMTCDLPETFESYIRFFKGYLPLARRVADNYVGMHNPERQTDPGTNGWVVGTGVNAYSVGRPGGHSGPGTGGFTSKLLMEYFNYTQDMDYLRETGYPALLEMSRFYDKALKPYGEDLLLIEPSASPEQVVTDPKTIEGKPGRLIGNRYYMTIGTTFDQGFVWENHNDVLKAASILGVEDDFIEKIRKQIGMLDPILIGDSGQIKEFREETVYSEIGEPWHRHISHLCPLYPGTLINSETPEWMQAASKTLDLRGDKSTGWGMAHRMNCRARLKEGEKAYRVYQAFIEDKAAPNLWALHPPFQIDGNLGVMAGMAEMLLQSHEGFIDILPALPKAWNNGEFKGLVARGNFSCSVTWQDGRATEIRITSRSGLDCAIKYEDIADARIIDAHGTALMPEKRSRDLVQFSTEKGATYTIQL